MPNSELILTLAEYLGVVAVVLIAALSPSFQKRVPLIFQFPRREGLVSLFLYSLILILNLLLSSKGLGPALSAPASLFGTAWPRLLLAVISLLAFVAALVVRRQPPLSAGWKRTLFGPSFRLALALIFLTLFLRGEMFKLFKGITPTQGYALLAWLGIALAEETIFRGYLQLRLSSWLGGVAGWLVTALLFVVWQLPFLTATGEGLPIRLALAALQAVLLGWVMRKTGHVLAPALWRAVSQWTLFL